MMDTVRLFFDTFDFSDSIGNGWRIILNIVDNCAMVNCQHTGMPSLFKWLVLRFYEEIKDNIIEDEYGFILEYLACCYIPGALTLWLRLGPKNAIEAESEDGTTILLTRVKNFMARLFTCIGRGACVRRRP